MAISLGTSKHLARQGYLALADGTVFEGRLFGLEAGAVGEVVFTTGMCGYQEVLSDPSYCGQIVVMTSAHIGNTGVNALDAESRDGRPMLSGLVVSQLTTTPSNYRSEQSLHDHLARFGKPLLSGVDTRRLTRHIRDRGAQNACIGIGRPDTLVDRARAAPSMEGLDLVARVTPASCYTFAESGGSWSAHGTSPVRCDGLHVVVLDLGVKRSILRCLVDLGCRVTAVPASTTPSAVLALAPDGILVSNGPGDPAALPYVTSTIAALLGVLPIFGICLGHQLLARALGGATYKLRFGHRGLNQPVQELSSGRVQITAQNHGFVVDMASLGERATTTHVHLNDGTSEGLIAAEAGAFSVQYHPEAAAGPHDSLHLFEQFMHAMRGQPLTAAEASSSRRLFSAFAPEPSL